MITFEKKKRVQEGNFHVYFRGNNRTIVFYDDIERVEFLKKLYFASIRYETFIWAFVLMTNHVHIQLVTKRLTDFMKGFLQSYVRWYNIKNQTNDKLFKTPFNSTSKKSEKWIIDSLLYILQNPIRAGICQHPSEYKWSSYHFHFNRFSSLRKYIKVDTSFLDKKIINITNLNIAIRERMLAIPEIKENQSGTWENIPDHKLAENIKIYLQGKSIYMLTIDEVESLLRFLKKETKASYRQIASLTHQNYNYVIKICKEKQRNEPVKST